MRNLTVKREKNKVAFLVKMKVYIEDPAGELLINNHPCRKIGELKNGEEKTFQIEERAMRVYVIADTVSKDYCNDFYEIPQGGEDLYLSGKNKFSLASGNAFRFNNNENEAVLKNRKRGKKIGIAVLIAAVLIGAVAGAYISRSLFNDPAPAEKTFTSNGMSITLTDGFERFNTENFTDAYSTQDVAVFILKEPFSAAQGLEDLSIDEYIDVIIKTNAVDPAEKKNNGELHGFEYEIKPSGENKTYHYRSYAFKTDDAFWLVNFTTLDYKAKQYADSIDLWAKSVTFS